MQTGYKKMCANTDFVGLRNIYKWPLLVLAVRPVRRVFQYPGLLRTPADISPPIASYFFPDTWFPIFSTASDAVNLVQYRKCPALIHHTKPHSPKTKSSPDVCRGHILKQGRRSHSFGIHLGCILCIRDIRVQVHSLISCLTPHSLSLYSMISVSRTVYSFPCPSVEFYATSHSWV